MTHTANNQERTGRESHPWSNSPNYDSKRATASFVAYRKRLQNKKRRGGSWWGSAV